jgi:hypothetical protein
LQAVHQPCSVLSESDIDMCPLPSENGNRVVLGLRLILHYYLLSSAISSGNSKLWHCSNVDFRSGITLDPQLADDLLRRDRHVETYKLGFWVFPRRLSEDK